MEIDEKNQIDSRTSRAALNRGSTSRVSESRPPITFGGGSRFNLPTSVVQKLKDAGKVPGFVVYSSSNEEQKENYFAAMERGWKPLTANEFPELARQYELSPFSTKEADQLIKRGGQIAMVRDKETDNAEKEHYDSERERERMMLQQYSWDGGNVKPIIDQRKRGIK